MDRVNHQSPLSTGAGPGRSGGTPDEDAGDEEGGRSGGKPDEDAGDEEGGRSGGTPDEDAGDEEGGVAFAFLPTACPLQ